MYDHTELIKRIESFPKNNFINDLKPFVQFKERDNLNDLFNYVVKFLKQNLTSNNPLG